MPWAKIDDDLFAHEKTMIAGNEAMGVWVRLLSWSAHNLTNGVVHPRICAEFSGGNLKLIEALIDAGFLEQIESGYVLHDYLKYNPPASKVKQNRKTVSKIRAEQGRKGGLATQAKFKQTVKQTVKQNSSNASSTESSPVPVPVPVPIHDLPNGNTSQVDTNAEGSEPSEHVSLPPPFCEIPLLAGKVFPVTDDLIAELSAANPAVDVKREALAARQWCLANPTKMKRNGRAFFLRWVQRAQESGRNASIPLSSGPGRQQYQQPQRFIGPAEARAQAHAKKIQAEIDESARQRKLREQGAVQHG